MVPDRGAVVYVIRCPDEPQIELGRWRGKAARTTAIRKFLRRPERSWPNVTLLTASAGESISRRRSDPPLIVMAKRIGLVILVLTTALTAQQNVVSKQEQSKPGCLLIRNDGGHRLMGYFVAGVAGALLTGGKNRYVDSVNVPPDKIKTTYSEKELRAMMQGGTIHVIVSQKGMDDYSTAWNSCIASTRSDPAPSTKPASAEHVNTPAPVSVQGFTISQPNDQNDALLTPQQVSGSSVYGSTLSQPGEKDEPSVADAARKYRQQKAKQQVADKKNGQQ